MLSFVVVPQWQGSPSSRAMRLAEGAQALRGDLPPQATREVPVPLEAGDDQGTGIARFSSLQLVRERLTDVLGELDGPAVVIGGDCAVSDAAVRHAAERHPDLAVVWFDAHPDLNTPASSPSGAYAGMVLRSLISEGPVPASRVVLAGARSWDAEEERFAATESIVALGADAVDGDALVAAVAATGAGSVYVHIDLDVLDPAELRGLLDPEPFGVPASALTTAIRALVARFELAGATIASYAPTGEGDLAEDGPTILRIIGAISSRPGR
jgi:arginase